MTTRAAFTLRQQTPDVLTCIASLSNDEVFTPPELANRMLDDLTASWASNNDGADLWSDSTVRFLDPCTKSGIFLREITRRLTSGLAPIIPDLDERVSHILREQVFGIGITRLTSLLARRSVYCSKWANGDHSVAKDLGTAYGNIWFEPTRHAWTNGSCSWCGAGRSVFDREAERESHAYAFIHSEDVGKAVSDMFGGDMQFDVVIGNPPYQLASDGGTRDVPIYQHFVRQAKNLQPRFLAMVIPSRWMASGLGLSEFRSEMLGDRRLRTLVDFPAAGEVFPGVAIKAGVCYFLWDASHDGDCNVTQVRGGEALGPVPRNLGEYDVFVRDPRAVKILRKVLKKREQSVNTILARDKEFGWTSNFSGLHNRARDGDVPVHYIRATKRSVGFISRSAVSKSIHLLDTWKVLVPEAYGAGDAVPHQILGRPVIAPSPSACTQSYLFFHVNSRAQAESLQSYYLTRFFRFLVSLRKITQHATHATYAWVPMQDWDRTWTDEQLYRKYGISRDEQTYIASQVREMTLDSDRDG